MVSDLDMGRTRTGIFEALVVARFYLKVYFSRSFVFQIYNLMFSIFFEILMNDDDDLALLIVVLRKSAQIQM